MNGRLVTALAISGCLMGAIGPVGSMGAMAQQAALDPKALELRAEAGDARAMTDLGRAYLNGEGVAADRALALSYFEKADAAGDRKAPRFLGLIALESGQAAQAALWFAKGAENGDITSQYYLGRAYQRGEGVDQDFALAMQWYQTASERGDLIASDGMVGMASLYEAGQGTRAHPDKALALYRQAADLGNEAAAAALARLKAR